MYSRQVLDHFQFPRNAGPLAGAHASVLVDNPGCGDVLQLDARLEAGRITEICFLASGCVPTLACGSALTELVRGKTLAEAKGLGREVLLRALGGLPTASVHASRLAMKGLTSLLAKLDEGAAQR